MSHPRQIEMSPWALILFLARRNSGRVAFGDEYEGSGSAQGDLAGDDRQIED